MPKEIKSRREVLLAIEKLPVLPELLAEHDGHYTYEIDLEVSVYGRNYQGKQVGPYIRLLACEPGETIIRQGDWGGNTFYIGVDHELDVFIHSAGGEDIRVTGIPAGRQFGEMSVLAGVPRAATVKAPEGQAARILEIQRPALRLLRKIPQFRDSLDSVYRHHGRMSALQKMNIPMQLSEAMLQEDNLGLSRFHVYSKNHVLFRQGSPIDHLYVIKDGWMRRRIGDGEAQDYLGRGHCFGLEGSRKAANWPYTVTLLSRAEVLAIPLEPLSGHEGLREELIRQLNAFAPPPLNVETRSSTAIEEMVKSSQGRLISTGLSDATNLLVMDMELCVRCGRCSMACHEIHGQSRLVRRGIAVERQRQALLAPMACMHCKDPECLTGCPTGAISRFADGQVDINVKTCIGCGDCAVNCPYTAITMVPRAPKAAPAAASRQERLRELVQIRPAPLPAAVEPADDLIAVKCNLCRGTALNPPGSATPAYGCEENCPTGALARVMPEAYFEEIGLIEGPAYRRQFAAGRNIHRRDPPMIAIHAAGIVSLVLLTMAAIWGLERYGFNGVLAGRLDMRWSTGLAGLAGIGGAMSYRWRRTVFRRRAGALRYWMMGHVYLGAIGAAMILLHGGTRSGGVLTTALAISFDLVILTGLWCLLCYRLAPRLLNRLEPGSPLLEDDLRSRGKELEGEVAAVLAASSDDAKRVILTATKRFSSGSFLLRQFIRREPLDRVLEQAKDDFREQAIRLPNAEDQALVRRAVDSLAALRRLDALLFLQRLIKSWLLPHVVTTSIMLALLVFHIFQVLYGVR